MNFFGIILSLTFSVLSNINFAASSELTLTRYESHSFYVLPFSYKALRFMNLNSFACTLAYFNRHAAGTYPSRPSYGQRLLNVGLDTPPSASEPKGNSPPTSRSPDKNQQLQLRFLIHHAGMIKRIALLCKFCQFPAFVSGGTRFASTVFGSIVNSSTMPEQILT